jgi:ribosome-binding factor A
MGSLIQETLAQLLLREVSDPRLQNIVVTDVQMSSDLKVARIYFTKAESAADWNEKESLQAFKKANPYLRRMIGQRLDLRSVPELRFERDTHREELNRILHLIDTEGQAKPSGSEE